MEQDAPFVLSCDQRLTLHFDFGAIQSAMRHDAPDDLDLDYTRLMMGFVLLHPAPQRVLMIGLGGGSLLKYCHRHLPELDLTVAEINPQVLALRGEFRIPPDSARLRIVCIDGAEAVRCPELIPEPGWDAILVDGFTREGQPEALCSSRFYADCHAALSPQGVLVANLQDEDSAVLESRLAAVFDHRSLSIATETGGNRIAFACKQPDWRPDATSLLNGWHRLDPALHPVLGPVRSQIGRQLRA
jgi:spermidine synthase